MNTVGLKRRTVVTGLGVTGGRAETRSSTSTITSEKCNHIESRTNDSSYMSMSEKIHTKKHSIFGRRRLTAPALATLALLGACGGGEETTEFASSDTSNTAELVRSEQLGERASILSAVVAQQTGPNLQAIDDFGKFYDTKFKAFAKTAAIAELLRQYNLIRQGSMPVLTLEDLQNVSTFSFAWNNLPSAGRTNFETNLRTALKRTTTVYTLGEIDAYLAWATNMSAETRNALKQNRQFEWHHLNTFLRTLAPAIHTTHTTASNTVETNDDQRYLKGRLEDGIEEYIAPDGKGMVRIFLGNKRSPVERTDLVATTSWPATLNLHRYDDPATVTYGKVSTTTSPTVGTPNSAVGQTRKGDYVYGTDQQAAVEHYVELEIAKNGPFPHMTEATTRSHLRQVAKYLTKETGDPYDSYVRAQAIVRGLAQGLSAAARAALYNKYIDLGEYYSYMEDRAVNGMTPASLVTQNNVRAMVAAAVSLNIVNIVFTKLGWDAAKQSIDQGNSIAVAAYDSSQAMRTALLFTKSYTAFVGWGFLGMLGGTDPTPCKQPVLKWLPAFFGASDLTTAATEFAGLYYNRANYTAVQRTTAWITASVNLASGLYGTFDTVVKVQNWSWTSYQTNLPPLVFTGAASAISCMSYMVAAARTPREEL